MKFIPIQEWGVFSGNLPYIIAGPCSAESSSQLMDSANELRNAGVKVLRAGLWKPRTHPGCFEGVGEAGLPWLLKARELYGMKICTEVASREHVKICLDAGIDLLWIGARTTVNPFLVQEIADALAGADVSVLVKNPVCPDKELWRGALERLYGSGIRKLGIVHRGFTPTVCGIYRNEPMWDFLIEMKSEYPSLATFCDPSHISGKASLVAEIAQKALDLGVDGLMVESHCSPSRALSDEAQQIPACDFPAFLRHLSTRKPYADGSPEIEMLRSRIDVVDNQILDCLAHRMRLSKEIGELKKTAGITIVQPSRWEKLMAGIQNKGAAMGLDGEMLREVFNAIHKGSVKVQ